MEDKFNQLVALITKETQTMEEYDLIISMRNELDSYIKENKSAEEIDMIDSEIAYIIGG